MDYFKATAIIKAKQKTKNVFISLFLSSSRRNIKFNIAVYFSNNYSC